MPNTAATTQGPIHAVKCAHCGSPNDARELEAQQLLEAGQVFICDACGKPSRIVQVRKVTVVVLKQA